MACVTTDKDTIDSASVLENGVTKEELMSIDGVSDGESSSCGQSSNQSSMEDESKAVTEETNEATTGQESNKVDEPMEATINGTDEVKLIPVQGKPQQAKIPLKKRRRPPQQLVLLPTMTMMEALRVLNYNLKLSLVIGFQNTTQALCILKDLMDLNFTMQDIEQVKDLVFTLRKVVHFKHNSRVRNRAKELYTKIKSLYINDEVRSNPKSNTKHKINTLIKKINEGAEPTEQTTENTSVSADTPSAEAPTAKKPKKEPPAPVQPVRRSLRNRTNTNTGTGTTTGTITGTTTGTATGTTTDTNHNNTISVPTTNTVKDTPLPITTDTAAVPTSTGTESSPGGDQEVPTSQ